MRRVALGIALLALTALGPVSAAPAEAARPPTEITPVADATSAVAPPTVGQPWTPVSYADYRVAIEKQTYVGADGLPLTVVRCRAKRTWFELHVGSQDPPHGSVPSDAGPAVRGPDAGLLLGGFNGGFKAETGAGGVTVDGIALSPLRDGRASFVIDANGSARVGVWGSDVPAEGELVNSVRQNLGPLVSSSAPGEGVSAPFQWGATLGGGAAVARSAVGEDAAGDIIYVGGMAALPIDLANALIGAGATAGMELDINPEWVQMAAADEPGDPLVAQIPGQDRPADQVVEGWTRDFFAVLAVVPIQPGHQRAE